MTQQEASEFLEEKGIAGARTFLRSAREAAKLSQLELSRLSGVPQPNLNRIESGKQKGFTARTFVRLYNAIEKRLIAKHRRARRAEKLIGAKLGATLPQFVLDAALNAAGIDPFAGHIKAVLEGASLHKLLGVTIEEKKQVVTRLENMTSIDDPIVAEVIQSYRREIEELEQRQAKPGDASYEARKLVERLKAAAEQEQDAIFAGLTPTQEQAVIAELEAQNALLRLKIEVHRSKIEGE